MLKTWKAHFHCHNHSLQSHFPGDCRRRHQVHHLHTYSITVFLHELGPLSSLALLFAKFYLLISPVSAKSSVKPRNKLSKFLAVVDSYTCAAFYRVN